jgi:hypothetical protein
MRSPDRGPLETRPLHRDVERSSAKGLGVGRLQGNLSSLFVTLKPSHPQAITNPSNSRRRGTTTRARGTTR